MYFLLFFKELHLGFNLLPFERHRNCNFCFKTNKRIGDLTLSSRNIDPTWLTEEEHGFKAIKYVKCARLIKQMWSVSLNLRTSTSSVVGQMPVSSADPETTLLSTLGTARCNVCRLLSCPFSVTLSPAVCSRPPSTLHPPPPTTTHHPLFINF